MKNKNTIIKASAGSGKTYKLSNRFLDRLLQADSVEEGLDSILASTFTCKAAGEISDRIFTKFATIALDREEREKLREDIPALKRQNGETDEEEEKRLQIRLVEMVKNMYRMRTGTMDSYFQRIASMFSLELGLPTEWASTGDGDKDEEYMRLLTEAVQEVLDESETNGARELVDILQDGKATTGVLKTVVYLAQKTLPLIRETNDAAWEHAELSHIISRDVIDDARLPGIVANIASAQPPAHASVRKAVADLLALFYDENGLKKVDAIDWEAVISNGLVKTIAAGKKQFYRPLDDDFIEVFLPLVRHCHVPRIRQLIAKTVATRDMLKLIAEKLDGIMERKRIFTYNDVTRKVAEFQLDEERLKSMNHRLDTNLRHLLLDEFQDTSPSQWRVFRPLAETVTQSPEGTFFCVGDVKQAIFGWRSGVADIFDTMADSLETAGAEIERESTEITRRCRPAIIETLNRFFLSIHENEAIRKISHEVGKIWRTRRYEEHDSHYKDEGYCTIEVSPEPATEEETKDAAHLKYVCDRIEELAKTIENRPDLKKGIGVITRNNKLAKSIVGELKRRGIDVNGGGGSLESSAAVRYVISALTLADHPGNSIAFFHLMNGPLKDVLGIKGDTARANKGDMYCSLRIRQSLAEKGYGKTIQKYVEALAGHCGVMELQKLEKLREMAYHYDEEDHGIRTKTFVERIRRADVANPEAANISVTTLHSAKGLEYDIVVLPELHAEMSGANFVGKRVHVVGREKPERRTSPVEFVLYSAGKDLYSRLPEKYRDAFERQAAENLEEALAVLYVAMTRPLYQLVMIVMNLKSDTDEVRYMDVLRASPLTGKGPVSERILYECGNEKWYENFALDEKREPEDATKEVTTGTEGESDAESESDADELEKKKEEMKKRKVFHHVARITPSSMEEDFKRKPGTVRAKVSRHGESLQWGTAIHACFEKGVEWLDEKGGGVTMNDEELVEVVKQSLRNDIYHFQPEEVVGEFRRACGGSEIIKALSRDRYASPDAFVERERPVVVWLGNKILRGIVDRLVIQKDTAGKIEGIEIHDFKSNIALDKDAYTNQMAEYRKGIAALFNVDMKLVKTTLVFVLLNEVVPVD